MHSESAMSRLQEPQAKALQMGVKRLACRGTVGSLTPTAQVTCRTKLQETIQVTEALPRIAVTKVSAPAFRPAVDIVASRGWGRNTAWARSVTIPIGVTRPKGSLPLRLTSSRSRAPTNGSPRSPPGRLHGERASAMVSTFQLTRSTRLSLTNRRAPSERRARLITHRRSASCHH